MLFEIFLRTRFHADLDGLRYFGIKFHAGWERLHLKTYAVVSVTFDCSNSE
jgi:hypothetical protein